LKAFVLSMMVSTFLIVGSRTPVEDGLFFPTWSAEGAVPAGIVQGTLVKDDRCLYVQRNGQRRLVAWEDGMGFQMEGCSIHPVPRSRGSAR
jgi:hypothetical protein